MKIDEIIKSAVDAELRRLDEQYLVGAWVEFERRRAAFQEVKRAALRFPDEMKEERLVLYLVDSCGEPAEDVHRFIDQPSLILLPCAAGGGDPSTCEWERTPMSASELLGEEPRLWLPAETGPHAVLKSPTHPEIVERGVVRLEGAVVRIDPAGFPTGSWVLLAVDCGRIPGVTPLRTSLRSQAGRGRNEAAFPGLSTDRSSHGQ